LEKNQNIIRLNNVLWVYDVVKSRNYLSADTYLRTSVRAFPKMNRHIEYILRQLNFYRAICMTCILGDFVIS